MTTASLHTYKFILSGGGTGGHIFPAVAIAKELQLRFPNAAFLFVGALGKMEMEKVPKEGYEIIGLPIEGLKRSASPRNLLVLLKTLISFWKARKLLKQFEPNVVIGTGGYASLPICMMSAMAGIPTVLQEQNGFAGLTNRLVAAKAAKICTGFPNMQKFFPKGNWEFTGNPVRQNIIDLWSAENAAKIVEKKQAREAFGLAHNIPVLFITGGSLGAKTLNETVFNNLLLLAQNNIQIIWQMGTPFAKSHTQRINEIIHLNPETFNQSTSPKIHFAAFVYNMDQAYQAADVVISRAGAISISEICIAQKPSVLVPSPNVTDNHQTKNAQVLSCIDAAILVTDKNAPNQLIHEAMRLLKDTKKQAEMQVKLRAIAKPLATKTIADIIQNYLPNA